MVSNMDHSGRQGLINQRAAKAYDEKQVMSGLISVANSQVRSDNHPMYKIILDETFSPLLALAVRLAHLLE